MSHPTPPDHLHADLETWIRLQLLGLGYQTVDRLSRSLGSPASILTADRSALQATGASDILVDRILEGRDAVDPGTVRAATARSNGLMITPTDASYPLLLKATVSPPLALYVRGDPATLQQTCLTVVGTRRPSPYGLRATDRLVSPVAARGVTIISGLAYGIDAAAHVAALEAHGQTVAVLGSGIDQVYPQSHQALAERILEAGGAIVSEYPPGTTPQRHFFPQRNRILAGLAAATLVVEAGLRSGALITARFALEEGREVYAVPGPIDAETSAGTHDLIRHGAGLAVTADDLRLALGFPDAALPPPLASTTLPDGPAGTILTLLDQPRHVDELVTLSRLDTSVVNTTLSLLELAGSVRHLGGLHYLRTNAPHGSQATHHR